MAVTDQSVLSQIQYHVVEPDPDGGVTWLLGDWNATTVINYLNQRQNRFLQETGVIRTRATLVTLPNVERYDLPQTLLTIARTSWEDADGDIIDLPRSDMWTADHGSPAWPHETAARPSTYTIYELPQLQLSVIPASWDNGVLRLVYTAIGTAVSNTGITFTVPDECVPIILWGTLADMLRESARVQDIERADYCEDRYKAGVEATLILQNSWTV